VRFKNQETTSCDVLVIGSGGAGLRAAIAAAQEGCDVLILSKARIGRATNTYLSKSVIASSGWGDPSDNAALHSQDTLEGGRQINNPEMVARFTEMIRTETANLQKWGVEYALDPNGGPRVLKVPGHSLARHVSGRHMWGKDLVMPLKNKAAQSGVRFGENTFVSSLLLADGRACGATGIRDDGTFLVVKAEAVVITTGGYGHIYQNTNNAPGITGDGLALALKAGVSLQDMEFVQFYPTACGKRGSRLLLYEQILTQDGAKLKNSGGEDILAVNGYWAASITRDELAQVIMKEILDDPRHKSTVDMDLSGLSEEAARSVSMLLPTSWSKGERVFAVAPTTHFCMGGIVTDADGRTSCPGLFAAGEAVAGAHGANRLGGNALAEVFAMGGVVGKTASGSIGSSGGISLMEEAEKEKQRLEDVTAQTGSRPGDRIKELKKTMWYNAGILRNQKSLKTALEAVCGWKDVRPSVTTPADLIRFLEFGNMRLVSEMVCRAALERTESRGAHFRSDYPKEDDETWRKNIRIRQGGTDVIIEHVPIPQGG